MTEFGELKGGHRNITLTAAPSTPKLMISQGGTKVIAEGAFKDAIASLYYTIASQRVLDAPVALQFIAVHAKAGSSTVAGQFAAFSARTQTGLTLLVDCTPTPKTGSAGPARPSLLEAVQTSQSIDPAVASVDEVKGLYVARLSNNPEMVLEASSSVISSILDRIRSRFQFTVLDTPALDEGAYTLTFPRLSDGVVLVVEGDVTSGGHAEAAVELIERAGGKLLGLVFNKRKLHMPKWLYRRLS